MKLPWPIKKLVEIAKILKIEMQESNLQSKIKNDIAFKKMVDWKEKIKFLKEQILEVEKKTDLKIAPVVSFILKSQLIEWEIKQLITRLELHLGFSNSSQVLKKKIIMPLEMDEKRWTLGKLIEELKRYEGEFLKDLQIRLEEFKSLRNKFIHCLLNPGSIADLIKEAEQGLNIANRIISDIEQANKFLDEHDPHKK
jgi:hypothetical protein